jgi:hypothetical protein
MYNIVRHYFKAQPNKRIVLRGLTEAEAKAHCASIEATSKTCTLPSKKAVTRRMGPWFEGYTKA